MKMLDEVKLFFFIFHRSLFLGTAKADGKKADNEEQQNWFCNEFISIFHTKFTTFLVESQV
jgi:hypothetical protein